MSDNTDTRLSDERFVSFNLFGEGGFINPTPWSFAASERDIRWQVPFYDAASGRFLQKQVSDFDGGWRWFNAYDAEALTIYNRKLDKRAYFHLTQVDMVDSVLSPECLLFWAKSMVLVEHRYYIMRNWLEDHIRAMARRTTIEVLKEIHGESDKSNPISGDRSHLHPVR